MTDLLHATVCIGGLSLDQHVAPWDDIRRCLQQRGTLGPLLWRYYSTWGTLSHCGLQVFAGRAPLVLVTELDTNPGQSITNAAALLIGELVTALALPPDTVRFVECYTTPLGDLPVPRFSAVTFTYHKGGWTNPRWQHLDLPTAEAIAQAADAIPPAARNLSTRACA